MSAWKLTFPVGVRCSLRQRLSRLRFSVRSVRSPRLVAPTTAGENSSCPCCVFVWACNQQGKPWPHYNRSTRSLDSFGCALCSFVPFVHLVRPGSPDSRRSLQFPGHTSGRPAVNQQDKTWKNKARKRWGECFSPYLCGV